MSINNIEQKIDSAFEEFYSHLDESMFGLYIQPTPLKPEDDVEVEPGPSEETKELDFNF
jgi:hypothetical protein